MRSLFRKQSLFQKRKEKRCQHNAQKDEVRMMDYAPKIHVRVVFQQVLLLVRKAFIGVR